jgi:hypothetical protein
LKDLLVNKFLSEVKEVEGDYSGEEISALKKKVYELIEALCSQRLILHDPGTYALAFISVPGPVYFQTFFQVKSALKMLLSLIEKEDFYLDLPEKELPEMVNYVIWIKNEIEVSNRLFSHFFKQDNEEQERIQIAIKNTRWLYSDGGIQKQFEILAGTIEDEISFISGYLQDLKSDENLHLFLGKEKDIFEIRINQLLAEKSSEKAVLKMQSQIKQDFAEANDKLHVFKPNGFRLFDFLIKNHLSSRRGWQTDVAFFFRMMKEKDKLIHGSQKSFLQFLEDEYDLPEPMGKFKLWNDIKDERRIKIYTSAKKAIGLK